MNTIRPLLILCIFSTLSTQLAMAQGSLTPPAGVPTPSMKTLDQVEARTPLVTGAAGVTISAAGTITISQPGSYYLTRNLTITTNVDGLVINADAAVDLNGFGILGTAAAVTTGKGIVVGTTVNATIRNGFIKGGTTLADGIYSEAGFQYGVFAAEPPANVRSAVTIQDLTVTGVRYTGIFVRRASLMERCTVQGVGGSGIDAATWMRPDTPSTDPRLQSHVRDSHASDCGSRYGISASRVSSSFGHTSASGGHYQDASCGIIAMIVENSTGWATGPDYQISGNGVFGIHGFAVSYCTGKGTQIAIRGNTAVACLTVGGSIDSSQKHLGTP